VKEGIIMANTQYNSYIRDMAKCIDDAIIEGKLFTKIQNENSHMEKHVADKDRADVLNRVLKDNGKAKRDDHEHKENKSINSGFYSLEEACYAIEESIMNKSLDIAKWVDGAYRNEKKAFEVTLPKESYKEVGYGYVVDRAKNTIDEYKTQTVRIVLQKNDDYPLGFTLLTAYPDIIKAENREPTKQDLTEITKKTKTYQEASPTAKAYMLYQTGETKPYLATFKEGYYGNVHDDVLSIHMPYKTKDGSECKNLIRIKEGQIELSTSKMMDVKIAKWTEHGRPKEKIIYPGEDIKRYQKPGYDIVNDKRYVKIDSYYTRKYGTAGPKGKSVDLTRPDVFKALKERMPEAADIVLQSCDAMGMKRPDEKSIQKDVPVKEELNESLLPRTEVVEEGLSVV
jgi:hypothetical protein